MESTGPKKVRWAWKTHLEVRRNDDFSRWDLQHDGLSFKKPQVPLGVIGQQGPGQQLHQQSVEAGLPAGELHLHGTVPLGQRLQHWPAGAEDSWTHQESHVKTLKKNNQLGNWTFTLTVWTSLTVLLCAVSSQIGSERLLQQRNGCKGYKQWSHRHMLDTAGAERC